MIDVKTSSYELRCQKCSWWKKIPLDTLKGPIPETIQLPEHVICLACGSYVTTRIVSEKKKEKKS